MEVEHVILLAAIAASITIDWTFIELMEASGKPSHHCPGAAEDRRLYSAVAAQHSEAAKHHETSRRSRKETKMAWPQPRVDLRWIICATKH